MSDSPKVDRPKIYNENDPYHLTTYTRTIKGVSPEEGRTILNYAYKRSGGTFTLYPNNTILKGSIILVFHDHLERRLDYIWPMYGPDDLREYIPLEYRNRLYTPTERERWEDQQRRLEIKRAKERAIAEKMDAKSEEQ